MEQNRESPQINPDIYSQLIFNKGVKNIQWGKDHFFNKWCRESWTFTCKGLKLDPHILHCTQKSTQNGLKTLNVKPKSIDSRRKQGVNSFTPTSAMILKKTGS